MFGGVGVKHSDGRRNSSQSGNGTGRGLPSVPRPLSNVGRLPLLLKRSEAADCIAEHLSPGGGTTPHPGNTSRRSSFLFPPLSGFIAHSQNNHGTNTAPVSTRVDKCPPLCPPLCPPRLFFSFFFFYFFFSLSLLFFYLFFFFYITFLFFSFFFFSVSLFVFLFYFFFFSIIHFCIRPGGGKGLAFPPLSLLFSPLLAVCAFHNKTHGGVKKI